MQNCLSWIHRGRAHISRLYRLSLFFIFERIKNLTHCMNPVAQGNPVLLKNFFKLFSPFLGRNSLSILVVARIIEISRVFNKLEFNISPQHLCVKACFATWSNNHIEGGGPERAGKQTSASSYLSDFLIGSKSRKPNEEGVLLKVLHQLTSVVVVNLPHAVVNFVLADNIRHYWNTTKLTNKLNS